MGGIPFARRPYDPYGGGNDISRLIMEQGRIQADRAQRSGDIWGNAVQNIGQQVSGAIQQHAERKEQSRRSKAFEAAITSGDPKQIITVLGPRDGAAVVNALRASTPDGMKQYADRMALARDMARGVLAVPKESRQSAYEFARNSLVQNGVFQPEEAPEAADEGFLKQLASYGADPAKDQGLMNVPPGGVVFDPKTRQPAYTAPTKPPAAPNVGSFEDYVVRKYGAQPTPDQITQARKEYQQADDRPRITVNTPSGMSPTMEANVINRLTTQWGKAVAPVAELSRQVKLMDAGLDAARKGNLAQGAQMVLVTFQKILDPPSVVRESEYMRSASGLALMERVKGAFERLRSGGAGVPVGELEKFAALARQAAQAQTGGYTDAIKERIGKTADRYRIPRELVFEDFDFGSALAAPTAAPGGGQGDDALLSKYGY